MNDGRPASPPVPERALTFECQGHTLVGVLSLVEPSTRRGVLIVVGGPQYRAGSHRQFVSIARALACAGLAVLRFDVRGMGDSDGAMRSFETLDDDIGAGIDALCRAVPGVQEVLLLGLCDGASAALMYADARREDSRVAGLVLINPWVRSAQTLAQAHVKHYYLQRLRQGEFWRKLFSGKVALGAVRELASKVATVLRGHRAQASGGVSRSFQQRMADGWLVGQAPRWLVLSGNDFTAKEFLAAWQTDPHWRRARESGAHGRLDLPLADHTFSSPQDQRQLERWLQEQTTSASSSHALDDSAAGCHRASIPT